LLIFISSIKVELCAHYDLNLLVQRDHAAQAELVWVPIKRHYWLLSEDLLIKELNSTHYANRYPIDVLE